MIPNDEEIKELENNLNGKISAYKEIHDLKKASYFSTFYLRTTERLVRKDKEKHYKYFNYKVVNAFLFLIVFVASYNIFNFTDADIIYMTDNNYVFESSSPWLDNEYFADITVDDEISFDYNNYLEQDLTLLGYVETIELLDNLPEDELNNIYNNIKYKKM